MACGFNGYGNENKQNMQMMTMPEQNIPMMNMPEQNSPMMTMPVQNIPMMNMPMQNSPMMNMPMKNMPMKNMPMMNSPMMTMPQEQLEMMFPRVYFIVFPAVQRHCDMMGIRPGMMFTPTRQQLDSMVDGIYRSVEGQIDMEDDPMMDMEDRQFFPGAGFGFGRRRPFLRDLVSILLIRELLNRRRFGFPGF